MRDLIVTRKILGIKGTFYFFEAKNKTKIRGLKILRGILEGEGFWLDNLIKIDLIREINFLGTGVFLVFAKNKTKIFLKEV